jgi:hypothetical protein
VVCFNVMDRICMVGVQGNGSVSAVWSTNRNMTSLGGTEME